MHFSTFVATAVVAGAASAASLEARGKYNHREIEDALDRHDHYGWCEKFVGDRNWHGRPKKTITKTVYVPNTVYSTKTKTKTIKKGVAHIEKDIPVVVKGKPFAYTTKVDVKTKTYTATTKEYYHRLARRGFGGHGSYGRPSWLKKYHDDDIKFACRGYIKKFRARKPKVVVEWETKTKGTVTDVKFEWATTTVPKKTVIKKNYITSTKSRSYILHKTHVVKTTSTKTISIRKPIKKPHGPKKPWPKPGKGDDSDSDCSDSDSDEERRRKLPGYKPKPKAPKPKFPIKKPVGPKKPWPKPGKGSDSDSDCSDSDDDRKKKLPGYKPKPKPTKPKFPPFKPGKKDDSDSDCDSDDDKKVVKPKPKFPPFKPGKGSDRDSDSDCDSDSEDEKKKKIGGFPPVDNKKPGGFPGFPTLPKQN